MQTRSTRYLPGSDSGVFQGISVFVGLIVSLGSSTVIGNIIAGLVITYMRPFKLGDRIKLNDTTGDIIEKTPLVTRIRTPKNEVVTQEVVKWLLLRTLIPSGQGVSSAFKV